jgi:hypothetical protein
MYVAQRARERAEVLEERLEGYKGSGKPTCILRGPKLFVGRMLHFWLSLYPIRQYEFLKVWHANVSEKSFVLKFDLSLHIILDLHSGTFPPVARGFLRPNTGLRV